MADEEKSEDEGAAKAAARSERLEEIQKEIDALVKERQCLLEGKDYEPEEA